MVLSVESSMNLQTQSLQFGPAFIKCEQRVQTCNGKENFKDPQE